MKTRHASAHGYRLSQALAAFCLWTLSPSAHAHHVNGGATPSNGWEGLLSGLAHPVIGVDHLAFIVAAGLIATRHHLGIWIPIAFVAASLAGTGLHVSAFDLPASEYLISLSVVFMGSLLVIRTRSLILLISLASAAGILHGYAYGESIVGAEMTALWTYLLGLTLVQLAIGLSTERVFRAAVGRTPEMGSATLRWAAVAVCSVGVAYGGMQWLS